MARKPPANLIPLKDAPLAFASQRLRREWQHAQDAPSASERSKLDSASPDRIKKLTPENPAEAFKMVAESVGNIMEDMKFRLAPEWAMQESLLEKLRDGTFEAWGVESAPERKRELEMLPSHFFIDAKISWNRNTVTSLGVTYSAVQVGRRSSASSEVATAKALNASADVPNNALTEPAERETSEANATSIDAPSSVHTEPAEQETRETQRRKPGPRSAAEAVIATYNQLLQQGVLKEDMMVMEKYKKLFPVLKKKFPNERGLTYHSFAGICVRVLLGVPSSQISKLASYQVLKATNGLKRR
jgi:hypothetical protein